MVLTRQVFHGERRLAVDGDGRVLDRDPNMCFRALDNNRLCMRWKPFIEA
jgi:hypothetical protein